MIDWNFLIMVLTKFAFSQVFVDWIRAILLSAKLPILVNEKAIRFFSCTMGVR